MYLIESGSGDVPAFDLAVHPKNRVGCKRLNYCSRHVDPMIFTLLFPSGDSGWTINAPNAVTNGNKLSTLQFYSSRLAVREDFNPLHHSGKLFQQYIVHAYCTVETNRLQYLRDRQKDLRVECYQGLIDHLNDAAADRNLRPGNLMILPSTFVGGPRQMRQQYHDAMTIVRKYGRPDLFITFTCNPKWKEITEQLQPYQDASARPDIVSRVFQLKVEMFMQLIKKDKIFGEVKAHVYVIEFQKRGLPHLHSLFWLEEEYQLRTPEAVDHVIRAEIPDKTVNARLYGIIMSNNIHGPCGKLNPECVCMENGECKKNFPKCYQESTDTSGDGYPKYQRREKPNEVHMARGKRVNNRWVVPYNAFLSEKFEAHINVEMCHTIMAIKYLCKYFSKGHDRARVALKEKDGTLSLNEIDHFVDTRCITPPEAAWRLQEKNCIAIRTALLSWLFT